MNQVEGVTEGNSSQPVLERSDSLNTGEWACAEVWPRDATTSLQPYWWFFTDVRASKKGALFVNILTLWGFRSHESATIQVSELPKPAMVWKELYVLCLGHPTVCWKKLFLKILWGNSNSKKATLKYCIAPKTGRPSLREMVSKIDSNMDWHLGKQFIGPGQHLPRAFFCTISRTILRSIRLCE